MNFKVLSIAYIAITIFAMLLFIGCQRDTTTVKGTIVIDTNGNVFLSTNDDLPFILIDSTDDKNLFNNIQTYDIVKVKIDTTRNEIFPSAVGCYSCKVLEHGSSTDIDKSKFDKLQDIGYTFLWES